MKLKTRYDKQSIKTINLFLDKKLVSKLLFLCLELDEIQKIEILIDEILNYFCLDFIAFGIADSDKIVSFKSSGIKRIFADKEIKNLLGHAEDINGEIGNKYIKVEDHRQFLIFKHEQLSMVVALEAKHNLSNEEKETLGNEIMLLIKIAIYSTINKHNPLIKFI